MRDINRLVQKATSQHGLLTTSDFRRLGFTESQRRTLLRNGVLERCQRSVFRLAGSPESFEQQVMAATLSVDAVASHMSALRLWGHRERARRVEVTIAYPADRELAGALVHRSRTLGREHVTRVRGIPVTTLARTLIDVADRLPTAELGRIIDHESSANDFDLDELVRLRTKVGSGRRGITRLDRILARSRFDGQAESGPEVDLARLLTNAGLPAPVAQFPVVVDGVRHRLDLAYPDAWLAIEYDGFAAHSGHDAFEDDRRRQNRLVRHGWRILRFTARDLREDRGGVAALVRAELARSL